MKETVYRAERRHTKHTKSHMASCPFVLFEFSRKSVMPFVSFVPFASFLSL